MGSQSRPAPRVRVGARGARSSPLPASAGSRFPVSAARAAPLSSAIRVCASPNERRERASERRSMALERALATLVCRARVRVPRLAQFEPSHQTQHVSFRLLEPELACSTSEWERESRPLGLSMRRESRRVDSRSSAKEPIGRVRAAPPTEHLSLLLLLLLSVEVAIAGAEAKQRRRRIAIVLLRRRSNWKQMHLALEARASPLAARSGSFKLVVHSIVLAGAPVERAARAPVNSTLDSTQRARTSGSPANACAPEAGCCTGLCLPARAATTTDESGRERARESERNGASNPVASWVLGICVARSEQLQLPAAASTHVGRERIT